MVRLAPRAVAAARGRLEVVGCGRRRVAGRGAVVVGGGGGGERAGMLEHGGDDRRRLGDQLVEAGPPPRVRVPTPTHHLVPAPSRTRGEFRHVQHVRPNRGPHKKEAPQKDKKLPVSCWCNSSVHCSTGPQQNVDDDCCACRPRQCRVKAVGGGVGVFMY